MGYGFKIGGRGIILKPQNLRTDAPSGGLSISGADLTKTFNVYWDGDGVANITSSDTNIVTVSPTTATISGSTITVTYKTQGSANINITMNETKHYLADAVIVPCTTSRSNPTLTLSNTTLSVTGKSATGSFTIKSYTGDNAATFTASSADTSVCTVNSAIGEDKKVTVTYKTAGSNIDVTVTASQTARYNSTTAICKVTCTKSAPTYTAPTAKTGLTYTSGSSFDLLTAGSVTSVQGTMQYSANNSTWGATIPKGTNAGPYRVYYRIVGNAYYSDVGSTPIDVTISKRSLTIPTLKSTSVAYIGSSVSVGVNNYDSTYENQSGTSANSIGTHTVTWSLKNTSNTQWKDGTTTNKTAQWSTYAGTITWYVNVRYNDSGTINIRFTFKTTYNVSWRSMCNKVYSSNVSKYIKPDSWSYVSGSTQTTTATNWANTQSDGGSKHGFYIYQYESGQGSEIPAIGGYFIRNSSSSTDYTNMSADTVPTNGSTYYAH